MPDRHNQPDSPADGLQDEEAVRSLAMALTRRLGRLPAVLATAILVAIAAVCAVSAAFVLLRLGYGRTETELYICAAGITVVVGWPIIHSAQNVIRELRASRQAQRRMTERLAWALDRAEHASGEKSRFLATMSHELRTPLNAVIGFSDMIMNERLGPVSNERYRTYATDINGSGQHLLGIINEILDLAKIEAGEMAIDDSARCDVGEAIAAARTMLEPDAQLRDVELTALPPDRLLRLYAVDRMVRQILINILSNAVKFTPPGGSAILTSELRPNGNLVLAVTDTGIGMTAEEIRTALTPFGQVGRGQWSASTGTGLGLPLARAMMELHDGRLTVRSTPGRGTTIALIFPAARLEPIGANVMSLPQGSAPTGPALGPATGDRPTADVIPLRPAAAERLNLGK